MSLVRISVLCVIALALVMTTIAQADLAPPPAWPDTCSVKGVQRPGETCEQCRADYRDAEVCAKTLGGRNYEKRCRSTGANAWTEVWCVKAGLSAAASASVSTSASAVPAQPAPSTTPGSDKKSGCSIAQHAEPSRAAWGALVLCAIAAVLRRSSRRSKTTLPIVDALEAKA
jgi:hypothetical protein